MSEIGDIYGRYREALDYSLENFEAEQAALLKQRAKEMGTSEADPIRRCIDQRITRSTLLALDSSAWQDELTFICERTRVQKALGKQRGWTREELYDERIQRFSR